MKEIIISPRDEGGRLDKYLKKLLPGAGSGFLYRMLRKKNITLNEKKAEGSELLKNGDRIRIFFSDETYEKFSGQAQAAFVDYPLEIVYEDEDFIFVNKPCGMLTQKAAPEDISLAEYLPGYLLAAGRLTLEEMKTFRPAPMHRLDRNTSGLVLCAKTRPAAAFLAECLREDEGRRVVKEYLTITAGRPRDTEKARIYFRKEAESNQVVTSARPFKGAGDMVTGWRVLEERDGFALVRVRLYTGRPHQIRAHLSFAGTPVIGDRKYGDPAVNQEMDRRFGLKHQLLHADQVTFGSIQGKFACLSGRVFKAGYPLRFQTIIEGLGIRAPEEKGKKDRHTEPNVT